MADIPVIPDQRCGECIGCVNGEPWCAKTRPDGDPRLMSSICRRHTEGIANLEARVELLEKALAALLTHHGFEWSPDRDDLIIVGFGRALAADPERFTPPADPLGRTPAAVVQLCAHVHYERPGKGTICGRAMPCPDHGPPEPYCHAGRDGDCSWEDCPQHRDGEPKATGRHCPLDIDRDDEM